jgi:hypothetical protein
VRGYGGEEEVGETTGRRREGRRKRQKCTSSGGMHFSPCVVESRYHVLP